MVTQNKLLRILQFKHITTPLRDIYGEFSTLKLKDLQYFNICCIAHKFIHSPTLLPEAINDIFCRNDQIHDHDTRYKKDLHPAKIKTKLYSEKTISSQGTTFWISQGNNISFHFQSKTTEMHTSQLLKTKKIISNKHKINSKPK